MLTFDLATGKNVPRFPGVSAAMLDHRFNKKSGYTYSKSGVETRRFSAENESQSELAAAALLDALRRAAVPVTSIDLLISACGVQEQATVVRLRNSRSRRPRGRHPSFDVNASCLSW